MLKKIASYLLKAPSSPAFRFRHHIKSSHGFFSSGQLKKDNQINLSQSSNLTTVLNLCQNISLKKALGKFQINSNNSLKVKNEFGLYEKKESFYEVFPSDISLNPLQKERFGKSKEGNILLFENGNRQEIIKKLISEVSIEEEVKICLTGPRGVGKSHTLALLSLYLKNKIDNTAIYESKEVQERNTKQKFRLLYFNNPYLYYANSFEDSIIPDLLSFFGEDLGKNYFHHITKDFLKISDGEMQRNVLTLIRKVIKLYAKNGYIPLLMMDQINLLARKKFTSDDNNNFFFNKLQALFSKKILSGPNTDKRLNELLEFSHVIEFHSKSFFENDNDFQNYLNKLGYFKGQLNNAIFLEEVIEITGKHPYELMKLNDKYIKINWDSNNQEKLLEKIKSLYMDDRMIDFASSHKKFLDEKIGLTNNKKIYLDLIAHLDTNIKPPKYSEMRHQFINKNFMEVDKDFKLTSMPSSKNIS